MSIEKSANSNDNRDSGDCGRKIMDRITADRDCLILAPDNDGGYHHMLTERAFLIDNILNFLKAHPNIKAHQVTVYELRELNEFSSESRPT